MLMMLLLQEIALKHIRGCPTIPPGATSEQVNAGKLWPSTFCAFQGCHWQRQDGTEEDLNYHLQDQHAEVLVAATRELLHATAEDCYLSVYNEAIAWRCRAEAPLAGASLDRRALLNFSGAMAGNRLEALVCFSCACIHTYVQELPPDKQRIRWYRPLAGLPAGEHAFLGHSFQSISDLIGLDTFLAKYDVVSGSSRLSQHETFVNWSLRLPDSDGNGPRLLCCPEDKT